MGACRKGKWQGALVTLLARVLEAPQKDTSRDRKPKEVSVTQLARKLAVRLRTTSCRPYRPCRACRPERGYVLFPERRLRAFRSRARWR